MQSRIWDYPVGVEIPTIGGVDIQEVRRQNLRDWIANSPEGKPSPWAKRWKFNQSHISEILAGKRAFGERLARQVERKVKMPERYLDGVSDGAKEQKAPYHGILLTRAGALLGAEWEKLDLAQRSDFENAIYTAAAEKIRASRKRPPPGQSPDDHKD